MAGVPPVPAIRKVGDAIVALARAALPDRHHFIDRADSEPLTDEERPGSVTRCVDARPAPFEDQSMDYWLTTFQIDWQSNNMAGETIDLVNQVSIAEFVAAMKADPTLGGRLQNFEVVAISGSEMDGADVGSAILELDVRFFTPRRDFYTIVGAGGAHF